MPAGTPLKRKARGAFFTPPELVRFITRWAIRDKTDRVLEPSCGDAAFLVEAARSLLEPGADPSSMTSLLHAAEIHADSARQAESAVRQAGGDTEVFVGDFEVEGLLEAVRQRPRRDHMRTQKDWKRPGSPRTKKWL